MYHPSTGLQITNFRAHIIEIIYLHNIYKLNIFQHEGRRAHGPGGRASPDKAGRRGGPLRTEHPPRPGSGQWPVHVYGYECGGDCHV